MSTAAVPKVPVAVFLIGTLQHHDDRCQRPGPRWAGESVAPEDRDIVCGGVALEGSLRRRLTSPHGERLTGLDVSRPVCRLTCQPKHSVTRNGQRWSVSNVARSRRAGAW